MKTFVTISGGILLALSCVATSDARLHANRVGQTQSEPSNYNPDQDSQTSTRNLDRATTGLAQTLPSYESNGFPITPLQAQALSPKGMQERLSDPTLAGGDIQPSPHQAAVLGAHFAQELKSSGQFEIQSSQLALRTSSNNEIKKFAQKMIDDHTAADQKLTETLKQANLPGLKYGMDQDSRGLVKQLAVFRGAAFDRAYVRDQIQGHEKAVELLEAYSKSGDNDALKQLASTLLPTIKEHLQMAEGLRSNVIQSYRHTSS